MTPYRIAHAFLCVAAAFSTAPAAEPPRITLRVEDFLTMPEVAQHDKKDAKLEVPARVNVLRAEPGVDRKRLFVNDQQGPLYIVDRKTKKVVPYLDFNGRSGHTGIFPHLLFEAGFASGFYGFQFDPDYRHNGRFYTVHMENPLLTGSPLPSNASFPGFDTTGYAVTPAVKTPGRVMVESVLVEWTDTNPANNTFEGTARELLRVQYNSTIHPMDDLIFNPTATPGSPDWRVLYVSCGDGGSGEMTNLTVRHNPQRLDTLVGKILRISPDLQLHLDSSRLSENGRYRIPNDNPFVALSGARPEIWAYGLRNPHRLSWDVDPKDPAKNYLIAAVIGLSDWETVAIIHRGANYGYSEREGNQQLKLVEVNDSKKNAMGPLPADDRLPVRLGEGTTGDMVKPLYPVLQYAHNAEGGDAIASGFVYRGKLAALRGKYIFGDITTGHLWWADFREMLAADDGDPATMATIHPLRLLWKKELYPSLEPIVIQGYHARGGQSATLPGPGARVAKNGRSDVRLAIDGHGELFILSKADGMVREVTGARVE